MSITSNVLLANVCSHTSPLGNEDGARGLARTVVQVPADAAAVDHADYLATLAAQHDLLRRKVIIVLREPAARPEPSDDAQGARRRLARRRTAPDPEVAAPARQRISGAELRVGRRLAEVVDLLAPAGITVTPLDPARVAAVLAAACHPGRLVPAVDPEQITTGPAWGGAR